ncbi:MAG: Na+/H+ antiporter subunit E, partial [Ilumatobacteraceae bacterium]
MIRPIRFVFLVAVWLLLWGHVSAANVLSGILVVAAIGILFPTSPPPTDAEAAPWQRVRVRPVANLRLFAVVGWQLVLSNLVLAREIITPGSQIRTGVVACRLRNDSEWVIALVSNIVSLTPGTMPVHVQRDPPLIHVHVLHLTSPLTVRRDVARIEALATLAYGTPQEIVRLGTDLEHHGAGLAL